MGEFRLRRAEEGELTSERRTTAGCWWACLWTASGSTGAYGIARVISPLVSRSALRHGRQELMLRAGGTLLLDPPRRHSKNAQASPPRSTSARWTSPLLLRPLLAPPSRPILPPPPLLGPQRAFLPLSAIAPTNPSHRSSLASSVSPSPSSSPPSSSAPSPSTSSPSQSAPSSPSPPPTPPPESPTRSGLQQSSRNSSSSRSSRSSPSSSRSNSRRSSAVRPSPTFSREHRCTLLDLGAGSRMAS